MGDSIIVTHVHVFIFVIPVINYSSGIDTTFVQAFVPSKTVGLSYYICGTTDLFLITNFHRLSFGL